MPIINGARHATASWPGVVGIASMTAEISHGVTPGRITLNILPQQAPVPQYGDLVFDAGDGQITLRDCKVSKWRRLQHNGFIDQIVILDRRWKWIDLGQISAAYNNLDPHAKLIPWMIRSPVEIATACLVAMGETNYVIDLPYGFDKKLGEDFLNLNPPWLGVRSTLGTNYAANWEAGTIPPAMALSRFINQYGRRIIYQWKHDRVAIAVPGIGAALPSGGVSVASYSPEMTPPPNPRGIAVAGGPTRCQMRLGLIAVGEEWDGSYRPLSDLSYAPRSAGQSQIIRIEFTAPQIGDIYQVFIGPSDLDPLGQVVFQFTAASTSGSDVATAIANDIGDSADPRVLNVVGAGTDGSTLVLTGVTNGVGFSYLARLENSGEGRGQGVRIGIVQCAKQPEVDWSTCAPPYFEGVNGDIQVTPTLRLTYEEARQLAIKSIYRYYRVSDFDVRLPAANLPQNAAGLVAPGFRIRVPGFGEIPYRQLLYLLPTKVDQVVPTARDIKLLQNNGLPLSVDLYRGYSRDKPAILYGVASHFCFQSAFKYEDASNLQPLTNNTLPGSPLYFQVAIHQDEQLVEMPFHVYKQGNSTAQFFPADIVLETSAYVRNVDTLAFECFAKKRDLPNGRQDTNYLIRKYPDVQREFVGKYDVNNRLVAPFVVIPADDDADARADFYLDGMQIQFMPVVQETVEYNGLLPIELDGAIQQVSWHFDGGGCGTTVSRNTEHSIFVRKHDDRYREEFMDSIPYDPQFGRALRSINPAPPRGVIG